MGLRYRSKVEGPNLFFVTSSLRDRSQLFTRPSKLDAREQFLFELFPIYADALMGYVFMPSHIHLLIGCRKGGKQLSRFMGTFKSLSARKIFPEAGSIWMQRFDDLRILSVKQFRIKLDYIHQNPVRRELVSNPLDWKWSSARFWILGENHPVLIREWDWMESSVSGGGA